MHHYDETEKLKQQLTVGVSCDETMVQRLINASNNILGYTDAVHLRAEKSQNTVREFFSCSFAFLAQWLQTLFMKAVAVVFKCVDDCGCGELTELYESIPECEEAGNRRLYRLVDGSLVFLETSTAVTKTCGTGGPSGADTSN